MKAEVIRAKGFKEISKYSSGSRLTRKQAINAKCYDCMGGYVDGKVDCQIEDCPMYPWMPYRNIRNPVED